jgi:hypothetical protein
MNQITQTENKQIPPWLKPLWESLDLQNFPNAVLIHGQAGIGKFEFALELAKALLCESPNKMQSKPCNHCEACHWFDTANHPDFTALVPETHRSLLPHTDYESEESPKKGKGSRDEPDGESTEKKEKKPQGKKSNQSTKKEVVEKKSAKNEKNASEQSQSIKPKEKNQSKQVESNKVNDELGGIEISTEEIFDELAKGRSYITLKDVKDLKKKRSMLLKGRKEGRSFFENPLVEQFVGFGSGT